MAVGQSAPLGHPLHRADVVDADALGEMIAAAFVATLWGVLIANGMYLPISTKLKRLSALEVKNMEMLLDGVLAVQAGISPRMVEQKLRSALPNHGAKGAEDKAA